MKTEMDPEKEIHLEAVHLRHQDSANLGVVCVVIVRIVKKLGRQEYGRNDYPMHVQLCEKKVVATDEPIDVD